VASRETEKGRPPDEGADVAVGRAEGPQNEEIRALLARLGRPHPSGGIVVERAALMAEGADFDAAMAWILAHGGVPELSAAAAPRRGLYGARTDRSGAAASGPPRRFVLPPSALTR
jgi:hypothetical protein